MNRRFLKKSRRIAPFWSCQPPLLKDLSQASFLCDRKMDREGDRDGEVVGIKRERDIYRATEKKRMESLEGIGRETDE